ncbi:GAF and ANTAR domain-containing protein [Skermania sp. ID1734]|uniref:GAF and ANTAR domain-containing protein n=1 Tax=Skermania sp. ID1734 TaxID=2597516 RepID=UPI00117EEFDD|nr:GAF and ANTAR domain-containing protein [Skermania sp. ID1734]TSD96640.1 GAF and ANTAR domain-containing protein [Skermania sp. ID1734]
MTNDNEPVSAATVFENLAQIVYAEGGYEDVYAAICMAATMIVPGCDHASLMLRQHGQHVTVAASDDVAQRVDDLERAVGEGPCVEAIDGEAAQVESDLTGQSQWPALAKATIRTTPVRGAIAFRLRAGERKVGALNLFSDTPGAFNTDAAEQASILASFAAVAVASVTQEHEVITLRRGLEHGREIGKAVGLLMALHNVGDAEAFDILRRASQHTNVKLAELARRVVEQHCAATASGIEA